MSNPVEKCSKSLFEPNRGHTWKQDFKRLRKMLPRMMVCSFSFAFGIKEGSKEEWKRKQVREISMTELQDH